MKEPTSSRLESNGQDVSVELSDDSKPVSFYAAEMEKEDDSERSKSLDESSHKNRSKRESRRMRELEQAQFSLELLKVRSTSVGGAVSEDPVPTGSSTSQQYEHNKLSPHGSPASHGSFEVLSVEDMETEGSGGYSSQSAALQEQPQTLAIQLQEGLRDSNYNEKAVTELPNRVESPRATFYIASDQSPAHEPKFESPSRSHKDRRESTSRRPVVVLISMQKESPLEEGELLAAQTLERASQTAAPNSQMAPVVDLEIGSDREKPHGISTQAKRDVFGADKSSKVPFTHGESPDVSGACSAEMDIKIVLKPTSSVPAVLPTQPERKAIRPAKEAPSPVLDTKPPKAQKKSSAQTVIVNMVEKPSSTVFSPPRRKLPFSK